MSSVKNSQTNSEDHQPGNPAGVFRRAHITLLGSAIGGALAIVNEILCARFLGVNTYGLYALALILARIFEIVSIMGIPVGALHYVSIYRARNQSRYVLGTILASCFPPLLAGLVFTTILWLFAPTLAADVFDNAKAGPFMQAMALAIPFMALSEVLGSITRGFGHAAYYVLVRNLVPPFVFLGLLLLIASLRSDPLWVSRAFGAAYLIAALTGVACVVKVSGRKLLRERPVFRFRELYAYSFPVLLNNMLYLVVACTSILLLGMLQNDKEVGIFRACMQIVMPFDMVVMAINAAVGHIYPVLESRHRRKELADLVATVTRWMSMLAMGLLLIVALNRHDLLSIMGPDFVGGANTLLLLALGQAIQGSTGSAGFLLVMSGRQKFETVNAVIAALACVILNLLLIPGYGSVGAAIATILSCLLFSVLRVTQVKRQMGIQIVRRSFLLIVALAGLTALMILLLSAYLPIGEGRGVMVMVIRMGLIATLYAALYWFIGLDHEGRQVVKNLARTYFTRQKLPSS
ncbi:MAG: flippase [Propionivibrio sp.]|uniref:Flippase n=1 Tax=Candidatus Propionivibrio dominans TaxID=2954373 RepID=A0A9D7FGN7_9RHOO|nr:flippase [Candidatus Propionivibrio dominans]MBL0167315.1 flippase [Propionivibrio sp.]